MGQIAKPNYFRAPLAVLLVAVLAAGLVLVGAKAAAASAFPGKNGAIAFESPSNFGGRDIWVQSPYGSQQAVDLTNDGASDNGHPAFSPDGKKIAFRKDVDPYGPGNYEIFTMNADGTNQVQLTNRPGDDDYPSWSLDGKQIIFEHGTAIEAMSLTYDSNGNITGASSPTNLNVTGNDPQISPDGKHLAYWWYGPDFTENGEEIYVADLTYDSSGAITSASSPKNLTNNSSADFGPTWSPDGSKIAFGSQQAGNGHYDIWVMDPDGQNQKNLTNNTSADSYEPAWSPDGKQITFVNQSGGYAIYTMNADGTGQTPLTASSPFHFSPNWGNDSTPPTITMTTPKDGAYYKKKATVTASYSCDDGKSGTGVKSCTGTDAKGNAVANGSSIDTSTSGTFTFTVTAVDYAGNQKTATSTYHVNGSGQPTGT